MVSLATANDVINRVFYHENIDAPPFELHPGQQEAIDEWDGGANNVLILCGRQWGKTTVLLHILRKYLASKGRRAALIVPQFQDINRFRDALTDDGIPHEYNGLRKRLTFGESPQSTIAVFTSQEPDSIRGSVFDIVCGDEFAYWEYPTRMLDALEPTLFRRGGKCIIATTPPLDATSVEAHAQLERLYEWRDIKTIRGKTSDNRAIPNLDQIEQDMIIGSRRWRIEWNGEHVPDPPTTLWPLDLIAKARMNADFTNLVFDTVVVSVDPSTQKYGQGNECGIVVCGAKDDAYYVIDDLSGNMSPDQWGQRAVGAYHQYGATALVVEDNAGGGVTENSIRNIDRSVWVDAVTATRGKVDRALPIAGLYERGAVMHLDTFETLETQMNYCVPGADNPRGDDRLDAMVHGIQWLVDRSDGGQSDAYDAWVRQKLGR